MKIVAIDIRTTTNNTEKSTLLEFGAVGFDTNAPFEPLEYHKRFVPDTDFKISLDGIFKNLDLLQDVDDYVNNRMVGDSPLYNIHEDILVEDFFAWTLNNELTYAVAKKANLYPYYINVVGCNFQSKIAPVLSRIDEAWNHLIHKKLIDMNSLYLEPNDVEVPKYSLCKLRAGHLPTEEQTALDRARTIALLTHSKLSI